MQRKGLSLNWIPRVNICVKNDFRKGNKYSLIGKIHAANLLPYFLVISKINELLVRENSGYYFAEENSRIHFNAA